MKPGARILAVRLGAMGDVIHTLPAVASLKHGIPGSSVTWAIEERWAPLLEGNPYVDRVIAIERRTAAGIGRAWRELREERFDLAVDFQGLIKSSLFAAVARPERILGFHDTRERAAGWFYSSRVRTESAHVVDRNLELAVAAGVPNLLSVFPLPPGKAEAELPVDPFVLCSPMAGWGAKQWPLENYERLGEILEREFAATLVADGPRDIRLEHTANHVSTLRGLIYATRRAAAVVGLDSGPMHLAAALGKPGVAIFGPTDPARNGPYGGTMRVLRSEMAKTTYRRGANAGEEMRAITPEMVAQALRPHLVAAKAGASGRP